jgi:hypothetical protein
VVQVFGTKALGGGSDGKHFRMSRYVVQLLGLVIPFAKDFPSAHHNRTNGYFALVKGPQGQFEGTLHVPFIVSESLVGIHEAGGFGIKEDTISRVNKTLKDFFWS